jgi:FtsP/CotA-like multicopper oxidase with cupredoxin domain
MSSTATSIQPVFANMTKPANEMKLRNLFLTIAVVAAANHGLAATVVLNGAKDNTLYQTYVGSTTNSNGKGEHLFAGRTDDGYLRRGLIAFDLTAIPAGSTITGATLVLYMSRTRDMADDITIHRVLANWGEGSSNAGQEEGKGIQATLGDATWLHRHYPTSLWTTAGGEFRANSSGSTSVNREGFYSWSSTGIVADVQFWFNNPGSDFGWLVKGNEAEAKTSKRFDSREVATVNQRPALRVDFIPPGALGACCIPDGSCVLVTSNECASLGGTFQGVGTTCSPNPCQPPVGACCFNDGTCEVLSLSNCVGRGGTYLGDGVECSSNLCPIVLTPFVDPLPRPAIAQPISGTMGGTATYRLAITEFKQKLHRDLPATTVWGFDGGYPGPTIEAGVNQPVTVHWINDLRDTNGILRTNHYLPVDLCLDGPNVHGAAPRVVTHLHGGHVTPANDGYPENTFLPGESATTFYPNLQPAGTIWYHDHALGITRLNVYMGLAGFYLIRDPAEAGLGLPSEEYEIALAIQDRKFNSDGSLQYPAVWQDHFFGDKILVNGKVWPFLEVHRGKYRFRTLNGSTSRTYTLALSSGATFYQIGTDGGLLSAPVSLSEVTLGPGERADLIMDFAGYSPGTEILLTNSAPAPYPGLPGVGVIPNVMKFIVTASTGHIDPLPVVLRPSERLHETNSFRSRDFVLRKMDDPCTGSRWAINDLSWHHITEFPVLGTTEVWNFINRSGVMHPMHMHLVLFQVLDRQAFVVSNSVIVPTGPRFPAPPEEAGWKDTVKVNPSEIVRVIARFEDFIGHYPYHCHILEHEDQEMMRQFEVVLPPLITGIYLYGSNVVLNFRPAPNHLHFVQYRNDLITGTWSLLTNNVPALETNVSIVDEGAAIQGQRFYRIGLMP